MDENTGNQSQPAPVNQPPQSTQILPTPDMTQQPIQTNQTTQAFSQQPQTNQQSTFVQANNGDKPKSSRKKLLIIIAGLVMVVALVGIGVFASQKYITSNDKQTTKQLALTNTPTIVPPEMEIETKTPDTECGNFPDMLESCTEYICQFTHPITGEQMTREIKGIVNGKCGYSEQMPNGGRMDCEYTEEMRAAVSKYQKDLEKSSSFGTEISAELKPEGAEVNTTYTIDGEVVDNPSQEALDTGQCVVSGY